MPSRLSFVLVLAIAAPLIAGPTLAQVVVLAAKGPSAPSFPIGAVLPAGRVLNLKQGDRLELLDGGGDRVVNGPGSVTAGQIDAGARARLIDILLKGQHARPGIAATRGFDLRPRPDSLWQTDLSEDGVACVPVGLKPSFALADGGAPAPVRITRAATGEVAAVSWPPGASVAQWPAGLPTADGERYTIGFNDGTSSDLTWRTVAPAMTGVEALASDLLEKGCYAQLQRLSAGLDGS
jgi:hypothetical protein